jgi:hypothetical protein
MISLKSPVRIDRTDSPLFARRRPDHHPADRPKKKPMTTAIGFSCEDGILLGADTKIATNIKTNESKLVHYSSSDHHCSMTFAMSGDDMNFPKAAALACWEFVRNLDFNSIDTTMEVVRNAAQFSLAEFHREHIFNHPDRNPGSAFMRMLAGIRLHRQTALFESYETLLTPIDGYECIGTGSVVGKYLVRQYLRANGSPEKLTDAALLASCAIEAAIEYDEYSGGEAEMILVRSDGGIDSITESVLYPGYALLKSLQINNWKLMRRLAAQDITGSQIDTAMEDHFEGIRNANGDQMMVLDSIRRKKPLGSFEEW